MIYFENFISFIFLKMVFFFFFFFFCIILLFTCFNSHHFINIVYHHYNPQLNTHVFNPFISSTCLLSSSQSMLTKERESELFSEIVPKPLILLPLYTVFYTPFFLCVLFGHGDIMCMHGDPSLYIIHTALISALDSNNPMIAAWAPI